MKDILDKTFEYATIFGKDVLRNRYLKIEVKKAIFDFRIDTISKTGLWIEYTKTGKRKREAEPVGFSVICLGIDLPKILPRYKGGSNNYTDEECENIFDHYLEENDIKILIDGRYTQTIFEVDNSKEISKWRASLKQNQLESLVEVKLPEEIEDSSELFEGSATTKLVNYYERNPIARQKCLEHFGYTCRACELNMENKYGEIGKEFIHVHHKIPLSEINEEYEVDPVNDLIPLCPNCHSMIHRKNPSYTIEDLRQIIAQNKG